MKNIKQNLISILSLFTSFSTLLCCALPTLLVILGLGWVVATTINTFPFLITLSKNKGWMFLIAFLFISVNFYLVYGRKNKVCKMSDKIQDNPCDIASKWNKIILWISVIIWTIGFIVAFLLFPFLKYLRVI